MHAAVATAVAQWYTIAVLDGWPLHSVSLTAQHSTISVGLTAWECLRIEGMYSMPLGR